jgi:hypothetical protein
MMSTGPSSPPFTVVHSWDDVPDFTSENEEADFWASHELGDELWDTSDNDDDWLPKPGDEPGARFAIKLTADEARRLHRISRARDASPTAVIKSLVLDLIRTQDCDDGSASA